jgi:hypothetical protein
LALIVVIAAALTPVLSPARLAADSQFRIVRDKGLAALSADRSNQNSFGRDNPLQYLRFDAGSYGVARLQELAARKVGPDAQSVSRLATDLLAGNTRELNPPIADNGEVLANLHVYPVGRSLDPDLKAVLHADLRKPENGFAYEHLSADRVAGIYVALSATRPDNFVFMDASHGLVYDQRDGRWALVAKLNSSSFVGWHNLDLNHELAKGTVAAAMPAWKDLVIGGWVFRVNEAR